MAKMQSSSAQLVERCHVSSALLLQVAIFLFLLGGHIVLVWLLPYFPTQDGPSHIYNLSILKDLRSGGAVWGGMYEQHFSLKPNLGFHIIAYPLLFFFDPFVVEKLFVSSYLVMLSVSVPLLLKMIGKPVFPWSFFVFPATLSYSLAMGFYSYIIALPLVLLAAGICWRLRKDSCIRLCLVATAFGSIIYCFHLIACAFFVMIVAIQQVVSTNETFPRRILRTLLLLLPLGVLLISYVLSGNSGAKIASAPFLQRLPMMVNELVMFASAYFSKSQCINGLLLGATLPVLAIYSGKRTLSESGKAFGFFSIALVLLYFIAPQSFGGGAYFHQRIPQLLLLSLIPVAAERGHFQGKRYLELLIIAIACICFVINLLAYKERSELVQDYMKLNNTHFTKNSIIVSYKPDAADRPPVDVLASAVSNYALKHTLLNAGNYETQFSYFPVRFLPEFKKALPSPNTINYSIEKIDFSVYPKIEYLLSWGVEEKNLLAEHFQPVASSGRLAVWKRK